MRGPEAEAERCGHRAHETIVDGQIARLDRELVEVVPAVLELRHALREPGRPRRRIQQEQIVGTERAAAGSARARVDNRARRGAIDADLCTTRGRTRERDRRGRASRRVPAGPMRGPRPGGRGARAWVTRTVAPVFVIRWAISWSPARGPIPTATTPANSVARYATCTAGPSGRNTATRAPRCAQRRPARSTARARRDSYSRHDMRSCSEITAGSSGRCPTWPATMSRMLVSDHAPFARYSRARALSITVRVGVLGVAQNAFGSRWTAAGTGWRYKRDALRHVMAWMSSGGNPARSRARSACVFGHVESQWG